MTDESRRGFFRRLVGGAKDDEEDSDEPNDNEATGDEANEEQESPNLVEEVIRQLEEEGPDNTLPDDTIRALTANQRARSNKARPSWRPDSVDPFADGNPRVMAVELARELRNAETATAKTESVEAEKDEAEESPQDDGSSYV